MNSKYASRKIRWIVATINIVFALSLTGCGSIVYKDSASTYVAASRDLIKTLNSAESEITKSMNSIKISTLVTDPNCPVADKTVFIRDSKYLRTLQGFIKDDTSLNGSKGCKELEKCSLTSPSAYCANACMTTDEANCLTQLEQNVVLSLKNVPKGTKDDLLISKAESMRYILNMIQVDSEGLNSAKLSEDSLRTLTEYLDLLGAHIDKNTSDLESRAKLLTSRIKARVSNYEDITGKTLSKGAKEEVAAQEKYLTAFGKLASDLNKLSKDKIDADAIKQIVNDNEKNVTSTVDAIKKYITASTLAAKVFKNQYTKQIRAEIKEKFQRAQSPVDRLAVYSELTKYPLTTTASATAVLTALFDTIDKAHANLVTLINHPNDEQLKALRNAQFQEFKTIASDLIEVGKLFQ